MRRNLQNRLAFLLLLPAGSAIAAIAFFYSFLSRTHADTHFVNVAGIQRMLSEELYSYANMVYQLGQEEDRDPLRALVSKFGSNLRVLEHGGSDLPAAASKAVARVAASSLCQCTSSKWRC